MQAGHRCRGTGHALPQVRPQQLLSPGRDDDMSQEASEPITAAQQRLWKPFQADAKSLSINRQYLYQGTGFHDVSQGGWGWDPPRSWETCMAQEVLTLTTEMQKMGFEDEALRVLGRVLLRPGAGGRHLSVEHERCRQRYSGPSGYLSEEVEVVMRVGSGAAGRGCMRLRFTSLWLSRALRPQEDGDKVAVRRGGYQKSNSPLTKGRHRKGGCANNSWDREGQQVLEVLQGAVEVEEQGGVRGMPMEGKGDGPQEGGDAMWVPVLTYAQEGPIPTAHSVLTMDVAQHGLDLVLLCACLAQHRREGSKAPPRYRLTDLILAHLRSESPELAGILSLRGTQMSQEEEGQLRSEVTSEVSTYRAGVEEEQQDRKARANSGSFGTSPTAQPHDGGLVHRETVLQAHSDALNALADDLF